MRILFIRHGDPDYENDTLTEKGCREADLLAQRASSLRLGNAVYLLLEEHSAQHSLV